MVCKADCGSRRERELLYLGNTINEVLIGYICRLLRTISMSDTEILLENINDIRVRKAIVSLEAG